ncbi:outer membrane protein assembly factor [Flavobacteriaceae bacterium XHP0103]|uniref:BamA/TamA family outer membrane protein n=1 Tax=Marixanthotalea marina TaxID=2844359 RepID=UPI002989C613|nr:BamA/TamA family outer membrane protein [Marixanthotalea marina]MBU3822969.1 outer membrane protein assembly factor [Marixanthotalea marina]
MKQLLLIFVLLSFYTTKVYSQQTQNDTLLQNKTIEEKKIELSVMPYLSYNSNLKVMVGAIPMMMYKVNEQDSISPKSLSGASVVYTTNGSYFVALFNKFYFKEDNWRATLFAINGNHNSQFFMGDIDLPGFYDYQTKVTYVSAGLQRKISNTIFGGLGYTYAMYKTSYEDNVQPKSVTKTNAIEFSFLNDTRNDIYYPTKGNKTKIRWVTFPKWFGNDASANKILTEYNTYFSSRKDKDVIAARFFGQFGLGNIAFEQQVTVGGKDIRGYSEGKYRGDGLMALQGEYRYNFGEKMGIVGFAGISTIYGSTNESFDWGIYPAIGAGYRYRAFKTVKFNIGLDAAVGKDDWSINFRIGEAF